ncbi:DUF551 domain-containing protein [Escherichia coli]|uniref:DUF551 domain-containing protein n=1 Tax=Escherichia coli TaxID=562 RepID=UPI003BB8882D
MTTNNHPAHGPVSLERLHQIREILSKAAQGDGGNLGYAMADAVKVIDVAIAAFGAEPVGYFYADKPGDWYQISDGDRVPGHRLIPLYASPQSSPAVKLPNEFISSEGIVVQIEKLMAVLAVHGIQYERKGSSCRVDILQAGNSPVTPGGWISCSDRMPEDTKMLLAFSQGEIVAAYWNWVVNPIDYKKYRAFTYLSGNILDDVTHWMPLPEPPQEEVNRG